MNLVLLLAALPTNCSSDRATASINGAESSSKGHSVVVLDAPFISTGEEPLVEAHGLMSAGRLNEAKLLVASTSFDPASMAHAELECTLAELLIRLGDYSSAGEKVNECRDSANKHRENTRLVAYANHIAGYLEHVKGNYGQAMAMYEKALSLSILERERENAAFLNTLNNLGNVKYRLGDYESAISIHLEVLKGRTRIYGRHHQKIAGTLGNLGNAYQASGMPSIALRYHQMALDIWKNTVGSTSPQLAYTHDNIGLARTALGDYTTALFHLNTAMGIKLASQGGQTSSVASTLLLLSDAFIGDGDVAAAKRHVTSSIEIFDNLELTSLPKYSLAQNTLAKVVGLEGNLVEAVNILEKEIERLEGSHRPTISTLYITRSNICYTIGDYDCALQAATRSIDINTGINGAGASESFLLIKEAKNSERLFEALKAKARSLIRIADHQRSSSVLNRAFETLENLITLSNAGMLGLWSNGITEHPASTLDEEFSDFIDIGLDLLEEMNDEQLDRRLFVATDMYLGGRLLSDLISDSPDVLDSENDLLDAQPTDNPALNTSDLTKHNSSVNSLLELEGLENKIERRSNISETFRLLNGLVLPSVPPDQSIVEYVNVRGKVIAFVINSDGVSTMKLGSITSIISNKGEVLRALQERDSDRFIELALVLYDDLLGPISDLVDDDNLLIIPHDVASGIPFELLLSPEALAENPPSPITGLPYLIKSRNVSYGYSVAQIVHTAEVKTTEFEHEFLGMAPVFDQELDFSSDVAAFLRKNISNWENRSSKLEALPGTELELLEIAEILEKGGSGLGPWGRETSRLYFRDAVSEFEFKNLDLSSFRFVHLATHGFADREDPSRSGLLMETESSTIEDGVLFAHEIAELKIDSELVVLSSCDTAVEASPGSEITGLAKSFLYAGSRNVVASVWPSDDVATRILMRILYAYMAEGHPVDQALRLAKLDLIEMGGPIANPYYWAGFIHIGAPNGIRNPKA